MHSRKLSQWTGIGLTLATVLLVVWLIFNRPAAQADRWLSAARQLRTSGQFADAEQAALRALALNPQLVAAAFLAAESAERQQAFDRTTGYLQQLKTTHPEHQPQANLMIARLPADKMNQLSVAERAWRDALKLAPNHIEANSALFRLLTQTGRASEATPFALRVVRSNAAEDLLVPLARPGGSDASRQKLAQCRLASPDDAAPLVGLALLASLTDRHEDAIELLDAALRIDADNAAAHAALGNALLQSEQYDRLSKWQRHLPRQAENFPGIWLVRAKLAEHASSSAAAIRCYWELCRLQPESRVACSRLARLLAAAGRTDAAGQFAKRLRLLTALASAQDRVLFSDQSENASALFQLAGLYRQTGRFWEAYGWCQLAIRLDADHKQTGQLFAALTDDIQGLPLKQTADAFNPALQCDLSDFPLPGRAVIRNPDQSTRPGQTAELAFEDDSTTAGIRFTFCNGTEGPATRRMYELTGGGIGIVDFDQDGWCDVLFSQGYPWGAAGTVQPASAFGDQLYRNLDGRVFEEVAGLADIREAGFGQGITTGDFDSDGFPDLFVANIGRNRLWHNNGDGTFSDITDSSGLQGEAWTTSCVMVDFNADGHPDIYEVNYLEGDDLFSRICAHNDGTPRMCSPFHFDGAQDHLWVNDGAGRFVRRTSQLFSAVSAGKGLGIAVWNPDGQASLCALVANDTTPNFLFQTVQSEDSPWSLQETAIPAGVAVNESGKAEGCMGIALGDVDDNGHLDAFVTNFLYESNTLYTHVSTGFFEDRTRAYGLDSPSLNVLGFGTQFLDINLDGHLELFVANGHLDDLTDRGRPYRMPAHVFQQSGERFLSAAPRLRGEYFQEQWLGRAVARCDWNRDGRNDLLIGHLLDSSRLLTNRTMETGQFLSLSFVGVESPRDAIGTTLEATFDGRTIVRQLTAGDGYQSSNERRLILGTGSATMIERLVVRWPAGRVQEFEDIGTNQEVRLVEGNPPVSYSP